MQVVFVFCMGVVFPRPDREAPGAYPVRRPVSFRRLSCVATCVTRVPVRPGGQAARVFSAPILRGNLRRPPPVRHVTRHLSGTATPHLSGTVSATCPARRPSPVRHGARHLPCVATCVTRVPVRHVTRVPVRPGGQAARVFSAPALRGNLWRPRTCPARRPACPARRPGFYSAAGASLSSLRSLSRIIFFITTSLRGRLRLFTGTLAILSMISIPSTVCPKTV